jgi:surfeit locus 1 family protein
MPLRFRPMPGLTVAVLICLPILIGLGLWQYQRWQWKTGVLAEINAAVTASPLQGVSALTDLPEDRPIEFRRIQVTGSTRGQTWHVYRPEGAIQWQPFRIVDTDSQSILVGFPAFDDRLKAEFEPPRIEGTRAGYVRRIRPAGGFSKWIGTDDNPATNRWFTINPDGIWLAGADLYVDLHETEIDARELPIRRPDVPNNHVSYMLTWWSFALILLIIYVMLHRRAGRLSWQ